MYWSHMKAFSFLFCTTSDAKSTKGRKHLLYTEWLQNEVKRVQTHPGYYMQWKSTKRWRALIQNDWETTSINWTDKKKTNLFCVFCKCLNSKKTSSRSFKLFLGSNNNNNKKTSWKSHQSQWSLQNKYGWSKAEDWQ